VIGTSLRQLRIFLAVCETRSATLAAARCSVSQPAVSQALRRLERAAAGPLFERTSQGLFPTPRGEVLARRVRRGLHRLDAALAEAGPRLAVTATLPQIRAVVGVAESGNFTLAARRLDLSQPSVHRAVAQLEQDAGAPLFDRRSFGVVPTRLTRTLVQAARLALAELEQAAADIAEHDGDEAGRVVIGALPLARSVLLPQALTAFRRRRPRHAVTVFDGPYDELLGGLRRGEIDVIIGALRDPPPIGDVVRERLFDDHLVFVAAPSHPFAGRVGIKRADLAAQSWLVPRKGTPSREQFDGFFGPGPPPESIIECGSILLMREMLLSSTHVGCISGAQAEAEVSKGLLARLDAGAEFPGRPIGVTTRVGWLPTAAQALLIDCVREVSRDRAGSDLEGGVQYPPTTGRISPVM